MDNYLQRRTSDMHETAQKGWNAEHEKPDVQKKIVDAGEATPTKNSGKEENPPEFRQASGQSLV